MFRFCSLYSGSSGNSFFVQSKKTNILIDSGVSYKKLEQALYSIGSNMNNIDAILITHEHVDHVRGLTSLFKNYQVPIYANMKTWEALDSLGYMVPEELRNIFQNFSTFKIGDLEIFPFNVPHDSQDPCGFNILNGKNKISIATDLGHVSSDLINYLKGSSSIILESNYDPEVLKFCSYPNILKNRIAGPNGHLPNHIAGQTVCELIPHGLKNVLFVHLSKENNFPELAYETALEELRKTNYSENQINFNIAPRTKPSNFLDII